MDVKLRVVEGVHQGKVVSVTVSPFLIGRDPGCQLRAKDPAVSGRHSALFLRDEKVVVGDLGSTNGTLVNDHCLRAGEEQTLADGDRLQIGQLSFVVQITGARAPGLEEAILEVVTSPAGKAEDDEKSRTLLISMLTGGSPPANLGSGVRPANGALAPALNLEYHPEYGALCVRLNQDQMTDEGVAALRGALAALAADPRYRRLVLDFDEVEGLPVAAYPLLLALAQRWREAGGKIRLCSLLPAVKKVVGALKLEPHAACFVDRYDALAEPWD